MEVLRRLGAPAGEPGASLQDELLSRLEPDLGRAQGSVWSGPACPSLWPLSSLPLQPFPPCTRLVPVRDHSTAQVTGFKAVPAQEEALPTPPPPLEAAGLRSVPPGFEYGVDFGSSAAGKQTTAPLNLVALVQDAIGSHQPAQEKQPEQPEEEPSEVISTSDQVPVLKISTVGDLPRQNQQAFKWARLVDVSVPVTNFEERVPSMAFKWNFELDTFQKQAIMHLEKRRNVLVAAHTSAGKTVVAEYAIALSERHRTRAIYTSPIKALSNQKFHDFKKTFPNVGLLTGDTQINAEATCLIMTTEILRSMVYNKKDTINDLEYVIFDEVHYINDAERGHVWEEVLIMLDRRVTVIMLSATLPNAMEFAEWVGTTRSSNIYVITTPKRPTPLEHYLYTAAVKDELYMIVDQNGRFNLSGYNMAVESKKGKQEPKVGSNKDKKGKRGGGLRHGAAGSYFKLSGSASSSQSHQEKTFWSKLIACLKRKDYLPVVAFTFSRKRCDSNAMEMANVDLTNQSEKFRIKTTIQKCLAKLKGPDKNLPQVIFMERLLEQGVAVHHSGILPILKETVELLFQEGLVKFLFATETFAMGVNMPARTVVFDSIRKHDGLEFRQLQTGEYIQMAGRAGRRGKDDKGIVIILCKDDNLPSTMDLEKMILGQPTKLESKFRLTYGTILNLLQVGQDRKVEDMMARSFSEAPQRKLKEKHLKELEDLQERLKPKEGVTRQESFEELKRFYGLAKKYYDKRTTAWKTMMQSPRGSKDFMPGRVIIVNDGTSESHLAMVVRKETMSRTSDLQVLTLCYANESIEATPEEKKMNKLLSSVNDKIFVPVGCPGHQVSPITFGEVAAVTAKAIKVDGERVWNDWKQRQIPRFKQSEPNAACQSAISELMKLSLSGQSNSLPLLQDFSGYDPESSDMLRALQKDMEVLTRSPCLKWKDFNEQFRPIHDYLDLEDTASHLKYLLSYESMKLFADYEQRLRVLEKMDYIDRNQTVTLKGQVACKIGTQEVIITEIVLRNILADCTPEEIAASLSALVFPKSRCEQPKLANTLERVERQMKEVVGAISEEQRAQGMEFWDLSDELNFGLTEVVYRWACGEPFMDIMDYTDVQEGIIVRCIQRLDEMLRDIWEACSLCGEDVLIDKLKSASTAIKRDIVFSPSLYTQ